MPGRDRAEAGVERGTRTVCATWAVRLALERFVDRCRREEIGARIVRGYRERPQDHMAIAWVDGSSVLIVTRSNAVPLLTWIIAAYDAYHSQDSYDGRFSPARMELHTPRSAIKSGVNSSTSTT